VGGCVLGNKQERRLDTGREEEGLLSLSTIISLHTKVLLPS
jgi:hypothetical protein